MSTARNGDVELHYESFGDPGDPTLVLVNGLGSQCINYAVEWCELFVAEGYRVIRFDNRDTGLSSKLEGVDYSLSDMADDVVAVLDAEGVERAHVMGLSMGGMIVQRLAIDHPERLRTLTSVMSRTGEPGYGESSPEALAVLLGPPATSREEHVENHVRGISVYGSTPEWIDDEETRARAAAAYDRCFYPAGIARHLAAIARDGSRDEALRSVDVPTLVLHGSRDSLIDPSGGRHTAEVIPGARYVEIEGMGHDYPPAVWAGWVATWASFAAAAAAAGGATTTEGPAGR
jgi:pimeloyl-ACP methyl ester carboxylesterase